MDTLTFSKVFLQYVINAEMKIHCALSQSANFLLHCVVECYSKSSEKGKPHKQHSLEKGHEI